MRIGQTEWDTELMTDRVDVLASEENQDASGASRPRPVLKAEDVPCSFLFGRGAEEVVSISDLASNQVVVAFAEDQGLEPTDVLVPRPPSQGSNLRVGPYRFICAIGLWTAVCTQTT
jgi:hypothetical protein